MAKDRQPLAGPEDTERENELVPIKVRRSTYRLVKMAAAYFDMTAIDYLDGAAKRALAEDMKGMAEEVQEQAKRLKG